MGGQMKESHKLSSATYQIAHLNVFSRGGIRIVKNVGWAASSNAIEYNVYFKNVHIPDPCVKGEALNLAV